MKAIYPGSFDPVTSGHVDIIERAAKIFDEVTVAVAVNREKNPWFSVAERVELLQHACRHLPNVKVDYFSGLTVEYVKRQGASVIIRGLRAVTDFEAEMQMALTNMQLDKDVETLFVMTSAEYSFLSSRMIKELVEFGAPLGELVPEGVEKRLRDKMRERGQEAV